MIDLNDRINHSAHIRPGDINLGPGPRDGVMNIKAESPVTPAIHVQNSVPSSDG
jgi:hypothetical protein